MSSEIEQKQWSKYEKLFEQDHEQTLAYRYVPENSEQEQVVLKYFPPVAFDLKGGKSVQVTYQGIVAPSGDMIKWGDIKDSTYSDGFTADIMLLTLNEKKMLGHKKKDLKLPGIKAQRQEFKNTVGRYWHRHGVMTAWREQTEKQAKEQAATAIS